MATILSKFLLKKHRFAGFTLAELLSALAILGVIATFTIPKVLNATQNNHYNSTAKEFVATISSAYQAYRLQNGNPATTMLPSELSPFLNYVNVDTSSVIDSTYNAATLTCAPGATCITTHSGAKIMFGDWANFAGSNSTNALTMFYDPDGKVTTGSTTGPGKSLQIWLFYDGRVSTIGDRGATTSAGTFPANTTVMPPWFSW